MKTQKDQNHKILSQLSQKFTHFTGKLSRGPRVQERVLWDYISVYENTPKKLPHLHPESCHNFTSWFKEGSNGIKI